MLYNAQKGNVLKGAPAFLSDITLVADSAARYISLLFAIVRHNIARFKTRFGTENNTVQKNVILRIYGNSAIKSVRQIKKKTTVATSHYRLVCFALSDTEYGKGY